jgi:hypothetical protein
MFLWLTQLLCNAWASLGCRDMSYHIAVHAWGVDVTGLCPCTHAEQMRQLPFNFFRVHFAFLVRVDHLPVQTDCVWISRPSTQPHAELRRSPMHQGKISRMPALDWSWSPLVFFLRPSLSSLCSLLRAVFAVRPRNNKWTLPSLATRVQTFVCHLPNGANNI